MFNRLTYETYSKKYYSVTQIVFHRILSNYMFGVSRFACIAVKMDAVCRV